MDDEYKPLDEAGGGRKWKAVYTITSERDPNVRGRWVRIGTAFVNRDGSLNVRLDAIPINGMLHIRDWEPEPNGRGGAASRRDHNSLQHQQQGALG